MYSTCMYVHVHILHSTLAYLVQVYMYMYARLTMHFTALFSYMYMYVYVHCVYNVYLCTVDPH